MVRISLDNPNDFRKGYVDPLYCSLDEKYYALKGGDCGLDNRNGYVEMVTENAGDEHILISFPSIHMFSEEETELRRDDRIDAKLDTVEHSSV